MAKRERESEKKEKLTERDIVREGDRERKR